MKSIGLGLILGIVCYIAPILAALATAQCRVTFQQEGDITRIVVRPLGWLPRVADMLMVPLMYLTSGTTEAPQQTHRWNNCHLSQNIIEILDSSKILSFAGIPEAHERGMVRFHLPLLGGWKDYVVIEPEYGWNNNFQWHIGWIVNDGRVGISCIPVIGPVRMLIGRGDVSFFGVVAQYGTQLTLRTVGNGCIGDGDQWRNIPLL